jgi:hypothetical protein
LILALHEEKIFMENIKIGFLAALIIIISVCWIMTTEAGCPDCATGVEYCDSCILQGSICLQTQISSGTYRLYYRPENVGAWIEISISPNANVPCDTGCDGYSFSLGVPCDYIFYTIRAVWIPEHGDPVTVCTQNINYDEECN